MARSASASNCDDHAGRGDVLSTGVRVCPSQREGYARPSPYSRARSEVIGQTSKDLHT